MIILIIYFGGLIWLGIWSWREQTKLLNTKNPYLDKLLEKIPTCLFCNKPVNQMVQPWDYYFPNQVFHRGCQIQKDLKTHL